MSTLVLLTSWTQHLSIMSQSSCNHDYLKFLKTSTKLFAWYESFWRCYPFKFNFTDSSPPGLLYYRKDVVGRVIFPIIQLILVFYYIFIWTTLVLNAKSYLEKDAFFDLAFHFMWAFAWGNGSAIQHHLRCATSNLAPFYNQTLILNRKLSGN